MDASDAEAGVAAQKDATVSFEPALANVYTVLVDHMGALAVIKIDKPGSGMWRKSVSVQAIHFSFLNVLVNVLLG